MILVQPDGSSWRIDLPEFRPTLRKGLTFSVARDAVTFDPLAVESPQVPLERWLSRLRVGMDRRRERRHPELGPRAEILCRLVSWHYTVRGGSSPQLEVTVEEVRPARHLIADENSRAMTAMVVSTMLVLTLVAFTIYFYNVPEDLWSAVGHLARWGGALVILIFLWWMIPTRLKLGQGNGFTEMLYSSLLASAGWVVFFGWLAFSRHPYGFQGSHNDYGLYAHTLANKLKSGNWPLLLAALPWAAVAFKLLGLETAEKVSDALVKGAKKE